MASGRAFKSGAGAAVDPQGAQAARPGGHDVVKQTLGGVQDFAPFDA